MPPIYDDIGNAYVMIADGASHTVDVDNTGATYQTNEATYGEGEVSCWMKLDLSQHNAAAGTNIVLALALVSGSVVPYIDIAVVNDRTFNPASPDFNKLTFISKSVYGNGSSATFNLGILGTDMGTNPGSGIFYIFVGDGDFVGGTGVQRIIYTVPAKDWPVTQLGSSHRAAVATEDTGQMSSPPLVMVGTAIHQVFVQSNDADFIFGGPYVYRFDDPSWTDISGDLRLDATKWVTFPAAASDGTNLFVAWYESTPGAGPVGPVYNASSTGVWHCKKWNGSSWTELGTGQSKSTGTISGISLCVYQSQPTVAWIEKDSGTFKVYVQQWSGSSWADVGTLPISTNGARGYEDGMPFTPSVVALAGGSDLEVLWVDATTAIGGKFHNFLNERLYNGSSWGTAHTLDSQDATIFGGSPTVTSTINGMNASTDAATIFIAASQNGFVGDSPNNVVTLTFPWAGSSFSAFPAGWDDDVSSGQSSSAPSGYASDAGGSPAVLAGTTWLVSHPVYTPGRVSFPGSRIPYVIDYQAAGAWTKMVRVLDGVRGYACAPMLVESAASALVSIAWSDSVSQEWWFDVYRVGDLAAALGPTLYGRYRAAS